MRLAPVLLAWLACPALLLAEAKPAPLSYGPLPRGAYAVLGSPRFVGDKPMRSVAFSPDGKLLAAGTNEYGPAATQIHVWELATGRELHTLKGHIHEVVA